jgi:hypothetical protein
MNEFTFKRKKPRAKPDAGLRKIFHDNLPAFHWVAIESALTAGGIPDSNCCYKGKEFWVEHKSTDANAVFVRPMQAGWHLRRARAGGVTFFAIRRQWRAEDELYLVRGRDCKALQLGGLGAVEPIGFWRGGPGAWDWAAVGRTLLKG